MAFVRLLAVLGHLRTSLDPSGCARRVVGGACRMRSLPSPRPVPTAQTASPAPTNGPIGLTARDAERIAAAVEAELAASTRIVYASAWRQWEAWCRSRGVTARPAPPEAVAAYLAERAEAGLSYGSIDMACSAIAHQHHQEGVPDPMTDVTLRRVRRGLRRIIGAAPAGRLMR